jgi:predicted Zn-dependent peptidase
MPESIPGLARSSRLLAAAAVAVACGAGARAHAQQPSTAPLAVLAAPPSKSALQNGLTVVVAEDHATPRVGIALAFGVGHKDDPPGRRGMARLCMELLGDAATRHLSKSDRPGLFRSLGVEPATIAADVSYDTTMLRVEVPANQLELYLWLLGDRMGFWLDGVDEAAIREKRGAIDGAFADLMKRAYGAVYPRVREALFGPRHPYGAISVGDAAELARVLPEDVRDRARALYMASNATLYLTGDVTPAGVKGLVDRYFGPMLAGPPPPAPAAPPPVELAGERRLRMEANVRRPLLVLAWPTAPYLQRDDLALDVIALLLESRLEKRLVQEEKVAEQVSASQFSRTFASDFTISITVAAGRSPDDALRLLDAELDQLRAADPAADEAKHLLTLRIAEVALSQDLLADRSRRMPLFVPPSGDPGYLARYLDGYRGLTPASLREAANAQLPRGKRLVTVVTPASSAPRGGRVVEGGR